MSQNGAVRRGKAVFNPDPSGEPDPALDEGWERVEAAEPAPEGGAVAVAEAPAAPALPREITAKGPNGEDLILRMDDDGSWQAVATSAPPPPISAPVDHPLLGSLRARTRKPKALVQRAPAYNHRMLWYMKPDGDVVKLQGDPGNRAYYEDKGYVVLSPEEIQAWERDRTVTRWNPETGERESKVVAPSIRRQVLKLQRERAQFITMIRSISTRHAAVEVTGDLSITPTEELQAMLEKLQRIDGPNFTLLQGRERAVETDYDDIDNVDALEIGSGADLERKVDAYHKMGRSRADMQISGRQRMGGPEAVDLSGN
jgi:hypothetical protein